MDVGVLVLCCALLAYLGQLIIEVGNDGWDSCLVFMDAKKRDGCYSRPCTIVAAFESRRDGTDVHTMRSVGRGPYIRWGILDDIGRRLLVVVEDSAGPARQHG